MIRLSRKEIIEELVRQVIHGFLRIKYECRRFERYRETRVIAMAW